MKAFSYVKELIGDRQVASIVPSSGFTIKRVCNPIDLSEGKVVVEYGPGEGCFTRYLLKRMCPLGMFYAFETSPSFVRHLRRNNDDCRLRVMPLSAERAGEILKRDRITADVVISGIPFSFMTPQARERIISQTAEFLSADGVFVLYQTLPPTAAMDLSLRAHLEKYFVIERVEHEFLNLPPLRIYRCKVKKSPQMATATRSPD